MQITRETDYAVRCVLFLAGREDEVSMIDGISKGMCVPKSFLAKILQKLTRAGIVKSYRGVKGGFQLAKKPGEISLLDVIEAIQGPVVMNVCALDDKLCQFSKTCAVHPVWVEVRGMVEQVLRSKDFSKLKL
ncbi:MAG TPA: Rrf2 family transcriptional regulator [Dissulfurispiraceae bacterium]